MPLEVPPTFAISNETAVTPAASVDTEVIRTERSAGVETGWGVGAGTGSGAGVGWGAGSGVGVGATGISAGMTVVVAEPWACGVLVELGMKIIESGTASAFSPERTGVTENFLSVLAMVKAAPQGIPFCVPVGPVVWN